MLDFHGGETQRSDILHADDMSAQERPLRHENGCGLEFRRLDSLETLIISKKRAGFDAAQVRHLRRLVRALGSGSIASCKFLIFDLASGEEPCGTTPSGFDALVDEVSGLIFEAPVITVAWVRRYVGGADLDLALACSMLVGEEKARISFEVDLVSSLRSYALLAHKIGFVRAERLMEGGAVLDAAAVHDLMLMHALVPAGSGFEAMQDFVSARSRRHNAACGIYRAQRVAMLAGLRPTEIRV
jgi:hypothetical protein